MLFVLCLRLRPAFRRIYSLELNSRQQSILKEYNGPERCRRSKASFRSALSGTPPRGRRTVNNKNPAPKRTHSSPSFVVLFFVD